MFDIIVKENEEKPKMSGTSSVKYLRGYSSFLILLFSFQRPDFHTFLLPTTF